MAKEATLQIKMDSDLKEQVELLYEKMGTPFAEDVRIFAKQSVEEKAMPFTMLTAHGGKELWGLQMDNM